MAPVPDRQQPVDASRRGYRCLQSDERAERITHQREAVYVQGVERL
ncbi:hypothetical protein D806_039650 [Mycolicibacterium smegmatis MKD8]|uniref:Uncharacterized protein n=1 Tax=Mycolicibacterium smegmatis (strain MKD8) TaxID=1214915 RepID=A0A2U9PT27_MYCSE|nr:hypothetical protein D806_039650 [Mycolicibacterium smegmatis MKD8]